VVIYKEESSVRKLINPVKDKLISAALKKMLNFKLNEIGEILKVDFNSSRKSFSTKLSLKGETCPLDIHLENYRFFKDGNRCLLTVETIKTSKEWLTCLMDAHFKGKELELPANLLPIIKLIA
jgi:hypothetical protein